MVVHHAGELKGRTEKKQRYQLKRVQQYLLSTESSVCVLYGLRRTGKTTIMEQAIDWLQVAEGKRPDEILYLTAENSGLDLMEDLFSAIDQSECSYIFVDEASYFNDFIERAAALYDHYTRVLKKKIVIAGTNLTSIFVSASTTLYDRIIQVPVHHLTYYEHCRFVLEAQGPNWGGLIEYLKTGGLFSHVDCDEYLQTSIIEHLNDTLLGGAIRQVYNWIDSEKYADVGWRGIINSICLYSAANVNNRLLHKMDGMQIDVRHLQVSGIKINPEIIKEVQEYYDLPKAARKGIRQDEVCGLLSFLESCGFLFSLSNLAPNPPPGDKTKVYLTFPFMRYAFTERLCALTNAADTTEKSELLGLLLEGCAISEYHFANPTAPIHFWREKIGDKTEECDLVVTDAISLIPTSNKREAIEFKLGHSSSYSGLYALLQSHPEYELPKESCKKLEQEQVMDWIYNLGRMAYLDEGAHKTAAFDDKR